jgi:hypothetical protein
MRSLWLERSSCPCCLPWSTCMRAAYTTGESFHAALSWLSKPTLLEPPICPTWMAPLLSCKPHSTVWCCCCC